MLNANIANELDPTEKSRPLDRLNFLPLPPQPLGDPARVLERLEGEDGDAGGGQGGEEEAEGADVYDISGKPPATIEWE